MLTVGRSGDVGSSAEPGRLAGAGSYQGHDPRQGGSVSACRDRLTLRGLLAVATGHLTKPAPSRRCAGQDGGHGGRARAGEVGAASVVAGWRGLPTCGRTNRAPNDTHRSPLPAIGGLPRIVRSAACTATPRCSSAGCARCCFSRCTRLVMAGVAQHSDYRDDPWGRLQRTSFFVAVTTFGPAHEAERAIARVRAVHRRVCGTTADGRAYAAKRPASAALGASRRGGQLPRRLPALRRHRTATSPIPRWSRRNWA